MCMCVCGRDEMRCRIVTMNNPCNGMIACCNGVPPYYIIYNDR